jgi:Flp pilus assembly protein TadD
MLLQPDSELYIIPAEGGEARRMRCNTGRMNSWHSWSPNGRWLVFSSKSNGPYTQLFLTHIDSDGNDTPAVELAHLTSPVRAANIPEFVNATPDAIVAIREEFVDEASLLRMGTNSVQWNDYARAEEAFGQALELNPASVEAHNGLGVALASQGRVAEAMEHYGEALRLDPESAEAHSNMAGALTEQGRAGEAIAHYTEALRLRPDYAEAYTGLGAALPMQGKFEEAAAQHREAIRLNPDFPSFHYNLALALRMQGKLEEAEAEYKEAIRLDPNDAKARGELGMLLERQGKLYEAAAQYGRALKTAPGPQQTGQREWPGGQQGMP